MAGPATTSTQPQNPRLICFIAASGSSHPPQPHTYWLLCCGEADALEAEGPVKRKAWEGSGLKVASAGWWPRLLGLLRCWVHHSGRELQNEHWLSVPVGRQFGLKWEWLGLGWWGTSCLVPVCTGKSSQIYLALLTSLPCPLCSFFLKSCPGSSGRGFPWEGTPFSVLGSPDCSPWGR